MKIGIIAANNICYSPYLFFYTDLLDNSNMDYELIYPDRNGLSENFNGTAHIVDWNKKTKTSISYLLYSREVIKIIKKQKYDALILLFTNTAVFLSKWVKKHYKNRYIVDIRDYTHENNKLYFYLEKEAVNNSLLNVISSKRFTDFLPQADYLVCHNISVDKPYEEYKFKKATAPITIGYMGMLGYIENCKNLMRLVSKDNRFHLNFYGSSRGEQTLKNFAEELKCDNIEFFGRYQPEEKKNIILNSDILFNVYGNDRYLVKCAISNKFYDSMYYHKPILTSPKTCMSEMAGLASFSMELEKLDSLDSLYDWYISLKSENIDSFCSETFKSTVRENEETKNVIKDALLKFNS